MRRESGFTLVELGVALGLIGVVGLSFAYLYVSAQRQMIQSLNFTSAQGEASFALEHMKRYLTLAKDVTQPPNLAAPANQTDTLEFTWRPTLSAPDQTSRYELSGTDLRFISNIASPGTFETIARNIEQVQFTRLSAGMVSLQVTSQRTSGGDTRQTRLETTVSPRGLF